MRPFLMLTLALAFGLQLHQLAADSFWGDEILTTTFANRPPAEIVQATATDIHPPLYYLLLHYANQIPTFLEPQPALTSDWLWRFPSVLAATVSIAGSYRLTLSLLRPLAADLLIRQRCALSLMLLLSTAPLVIKYSQEARMHALFLALTVGSMACLSCALHQPRRRWLSWLGFLLTTTAAIYTVYFGFLVMAAQGAYVLACFIKRDVSLTRLIQYSIAVAGVMLGYLPWWPVLWNIVQRRAAVGAIEGGVGHPLIFLGGFVEALGPGALAMLFFGLFLVGLLGLARAHWPTAVLAASWVGLPALLPLFAGDPRALQFRYAFVLPLYLLTVVWLISWLTRQPARQRYLVWVLLTISFIATLSVYQHSKPDWRAAASLLATRVSQSDLILHGSLWDERRFIGYYYQGQATLLTPAALVNNIDLYSTALRRDNGRLWAVNRFTPTSLPAVQNHHFTGIVISEAQLNVYEPAILTDIALALAAEQVEAAYPWAAQADAQGVLDPDPRSARAVALRSLGDTLLAAGRLDEAITAYQQAVAEFPGWLGGYLALIRAYEAAANLPAAAETYRQAVRFNPDWQGQAAEDAAALVAEEEWAAALQIYHQLEKGQP